MENGFDLDKFIGRNRHTLKAEQRLTWYRILTDAYNQCEYAVPAEVSEEEAVCDDCEDCGVERAELRGGEEYDDAEEDEGKYSEDDEDVVMEEYDEDDENVVLKEFGGGNAEGEEYYGEGDRKGYDHDESYREEYDGGEAEGEKYYGGEGEENDHDEGYREVQGEKYYGGGGGEEYDHDERYREVQGEGYYGDRGNMIMMWAIEKNMTRVASGMRMKRTTTVVASGLGYETASEVRIMI